MTRRVLLVGATGTFGSRLAAMLSRHTQIELILAARRVDALQSLRASLLKSGAAARILVQPFDRSRPEGLIETSPWLVVDAAGPFQGSDYRLALAAVRQGAHYIDLADARDYVAGFADALDEAARRAGVLAVTAASTIPALSHAVLAELVKDWRQIDDVMVALSPGARTTRGPSIVKALLSYVGRPVRVLRVGGWTTVPGWSGLRAIHIPGLGKRLVSICETPDLDLLPMRFPIRREALFMAGHEIMPVHLGLTLLSLPVRWGIVRSLRRFAGLLHTAADATAGFGSDRGGMIVEASGRDDMDRPFRARWALWAQAGAGPNVPAAPAAALVRSLLLGKETRRGAMVCAGILERGDILHELAELPIHTRLDQGLPESTVLFERLLGEKWMLLPSSVRAVHGGGHITASGHAIARIGENMAARLLRLVLGLPRTGKHEVEVVLEQDHRGERWTRRFGSAQFSSNLTDAGALGLFEERFGLLRFIFDLEPASGGVDWQFCGWKFAGLPLPKRFGPHIRAGAWEVDGCYRFRVIVAHPWTGLLFAYRGGLPDILS
ncbi:hypothetical protein GCM10011491_38100 [Brucella endophytica]|uniref:Saccharopine dehydrogenase n=1 Tax=Brucella endophytica TaxID=1963359 RepID=A0A916SMI6_9HYPH|nr:SDR family oxidoreductase [Brucella endophytica]GGB06381.1 hypothetical protein GCM10011491_38100 [Brucella endophytica]